VSTNGSSAAPADRAAVLDEIRHGERFVLVTHENPDGDALGSLVAMHGLLTALGKDSLMFMSVDDLPLPYEYRFFDLSGLAAVPPADVEERTVIYLDCGNIDRNPLEAVKGDDSHIVNIDHHHDNTRFGNVNWVEPDASCTAEMIWCLTSDLDVALTPSIADALYVGLVTDTGRFMYENSGARAHHMAAALIESGVDASSIYRRLYEDMPYEKVDLLARGLSSVRRYDEGRLTMALLTREDFFDSGSESSYSEGIIDHLRSIRCTKLAALARELLDDDNTTPPLTKRVSLRATGEDVDVSKIARAAGGGGHPRAAGLTWTGSDEELVAFLREHLAAQLGTRVAV
jgi:bifunctional oligoribonuclease and PAP phosphatase NrnA